MTIDDLAPQDWPTLVRVQIVDLRPCRVAALPALYGDPRPTSPVAPALRAHVTARRRAPEDGVLLADLVGVSRTGRGLQEALTAVVKSLSASTEGPIDAATPQGELDLSRSERRPRTTIA